MAAIYSFFILLFITYSYSVPIGPEYGSSTTPDQFTTGQTTVEHVNSVNMHLMSDNESTVVPTIQQQRLSEEPNSNEVTTDFVTPLSTATYKKRDDKDSKSAESESQEKRGLFTISTSTKVYKKRTDDKDSKSAESESQEKRDLFSFPTSTKVYKKRTDDKDSKSAESESQEKRGLVSFSTSTITSKKREDKDSKSAESESQEKRVFEESSFPSSTVENFLFTTLESSKEFNQRAIQPIQSQFVPESSTVLLENQMKRAADVKLSSSVDSFGKFTGLLKDKRIVQSSEELTAPLPTTTEPLIKTVSIIPGKIIQTKVLPSVPIQSSSIIQPVTQGQLSQGQSEPVSQKRESDN